MLFGRRRRKFVLWAVLAVAGLALAIVALPLWFPWILKPLAGHRGLSYATYERLSYSRFALRDLSFTNGFADVRAERVECLVPSVWAWRLFRPQTKAAARALYVANWHFISIPTTHKGGPIASTFDEVARTLEGLKRWVPGAVLSNGTIQVATANLAVPFADWSSEGLSAELQVPLGLRFPGGVMPGRATNLNESTTSFILRLRPAQTQHGTAGFRRGRRHELEVHSDRLHLDSELILVGDASGLEIRSTNLWFENRLEASAKFGPHAVLPDVATLQARDFHFAAGLAGLVDYDTISGSASGVWENGAFKVELSARASPAVSRTNWPVLGLSLQARGDTNSVTLTTAALSAGSSRAELTQELNLQYSGNWIRAPAIFNVRADLSSQPWLPLKGTLDGKLELAPGRSKYPGARFDISGSEVGTTGLAAQAVRLSVECDWPRLRLSKAEATFADGSTAELKGNVALDQRTVSEGRFDVRGPFALRWLPHGISYRSLRLSGTFEGPLDEIRHHSRLEIADFVAPHLRPLRVSAECVGRMASLDSAELNITSGPASLIARGALATTGHSAELSLTNLTFLTNGQPVLELARPCQLSVDHLESSEELLIRCTPIDWLGRGGELHVQPSSVSAQAGAFEMAASGLSSSLVRGFLKAELPPTEVRTLSARLGWTNGPAAGHIELSATGHLPGATGFERVFDFLSFGAEPNTQEGISNPASVPAQGSAASTQAPQPERVGSTSPQSNNPEFSVRLSLSCDQNGLAMSNLVVTSQTSQVVIVRGFLPLTLRPDFRGNLLHLDRQAPLECTASVHPQGPFWRGISAWTGVAFQNPRLEAMVSGCWQNPRGRLVLQADEIQYRRPGVTLPSLKELNLNVQVDARQALLTQGELRIQGQPLALTAEVQLGAEFWAGLGSNVPLGWSNATAHVEMKNIELAAFQPLYPELLTPEGTLNVDVFLRPGRNLEGTAVLARARTRPLGQLGPVRDIGATLRFAGQQVRLEEATASVGRAPVQLTGQANLQGFHWLRGVMPPFELSLRGTNVLLQRQPESIIRADLDLTVLKTNGAAPLIAGSVRLRDSYYLRDLSALVPGRIASPERRPPYFSITDPALADWRLALSINGTRFMRIRGPLFNGEVSTALRIQGTLMDPLALGDGKVDSGFVRFPFATFQVQQGIVTLTTKDPYRPELLVNAASKQYGYDIRMEVTGPADAPVVQFTSTPPLSSEQILLMVTAGEMPQATFSLTTQQRAQTVALFFGKDLLAKLGLGDQSQSRLEVSSGEEISDQGRPSYNVEYKLTDHWSVVGAYDRFGDFNAGFKWLIYSK